MLSLLLAVSLPILPPQAQADVVEEARRAIGTPYTLGGRLRRSDDGLDCQGLVFFALQKISPCGWRSYSVLPTTSVKGELGDPVPGAAPIRAADVHLAIPALEPGDVIWWLASPENPAEASLAVLDDKAMWVWHVGLYAGAGKVIIGDHVAGRVVEEDLAAYTRAHYEGLFATRMKTSPRPRRCREHPPMVIQSRVQP